MNKDLMMEILINDGCTKIGAKQHIELGTVIYTEENINELEEEFGVTKEQIETGNGGDIVATVYNGIKYYIAYAN